MALDIERVIGNEFTNCNHGFFETLQLQFGKVFVFGLCWMFEIHAMASCCIRHEVWRVLQQLEDKIVGVLRFDVEVRKSVTGKVS
jgi:hypothetical protein